MFDTSPSLIPCHRWHAISILLANDPLILDLLFTEEDRRLRASPQDLISYASTMSSGQRLLVKAALAIWEGSGELDFGDLIDRLDPCRFESLLLALEFYRYGKRLATRN